MNKRKSENLSDNNDLPEQLNPKETKGKYHPKHKRIWYLLDIAFFTILALYGITKITPLGIIYYISGLVNGMSFLFLFFMLFFLLFYAFAMNPILIVPLLVLILTFFIYRIIFIWPKRIRSRKQLVVCWLLAFCSFVLFICQFFFQFSSSSKSYEMYSRGFSRYIQIRTDIDDIQQWLSSLDPNECLGQPLNFQYTPLYSQEQIFIAEPKSIARINPKFSRISLDEQGRPKVILSWGSGVMGSWGIVVGNENMEIPETVLPEEKENTIGAKTNVFREHCEYRLPIAPGAYVWYDLD